MNENARQSKLAELAWTSYGPRRIIAVGMDKPIRAVPSVKVDAAITWQREAVRLDEENERLRAELAALKQAQPKLRLWPFGWLPQRANPVY